MWSNIKFFYSQFVNARDYLKGIQVYESIVRSFSSFPGLIENTISSWATIHTICHIWQFIVSFIPISFPWFPTFPTQIPLRQRASILLDQKFWTGCRAREMIQRTSAKNICTMVIQHILTLHLLKCIRKCHLEKVSSLCITSKIHAPLSFENNICRSAQ